MKKILIAFELERAIKMAPLIKSTSSFQIIVCVTGQHRQMLDQVLELFEIKPDIDLDIMKESQDLFDITSRILLEFKDVLIDIEPDLVLVHGDTTTSMTYALSSFYHNTPVGHVEAGLRTFNIYSPFPEELNRQITARIAKFNFVPTPNSKINLIREGVKEDTIFITGNTIVDSLETIKSRALKEKFPAKILIDLPF